MEKDMDGKQTGLSATEENRTTLVCVDRYDRRIPEGRFYHPVRPDGGRFYGLVDFLRQADGLMDDARLPQRYTETRSFAGVRQEQAAWETPDPLLPEHGRLATFRLRVLFRRNSSWQGTLSWLEGKKEEPFRSVLELILLLDSALGSSRSGER